MEVDVLHWVSAPRRRLRAGWDDATRHAVDIGQDLVGKVAEFGEQLGARVHTKVGVAAVPEEAFIEHARRHPGLIVLESTRSPVRRRGVPEVRKKTRACTRKVPNFERATAPGLNDRLARDEGRPPLTLRQPLPTQ
jgi:hypothetical protein